MEWTSKLENDDHGLIGKAFSDKKREIKNFQVVKSMVPSSISEVFTCHVLKLMLSLDSEYYFNEFTLVSWFKLIFSKKIFILIK